MNSTPINLGIVGVGKIVHDQHLPAISSNERFRLIATASRNASLDGIAGYKNIEEMIDATPALQAVALCMPPQYRFEAAKYALSRGLHVLLEKPPGATVSEVEVLADIATTNNCSLFATWHSRYGAAVEKAKALLATSSLQTVRLTWKEDVRKWHPGQEWIWQAGGLGVFDPGINGLSILTHVLPAAAYVVQSSLTFPENKAAPIAAKLQLKTANDVAIEVEFDWRQSGDEMWNIHFATEQGEVLIADGGALVQLNGEIISLEEQNEYQGIYHRFAKLIEQQVSDVDLAPIKLVADAFLLGDRSVEPPFFD